MASVALNLACLWDKSYDQKIILLELDQEPEISDCSEDDFITLGKTLTFKPKNKPPLEATKTNSKISQTYANKSNHVFDEFNHRRAPLATLQIPEPIENVLVEVQERVTLGTKLAENNPRQTTRKRKQTNFYVKKINALDRQDARLNPLSENENTDQIRQHEYKCA